ncbi:MAG: FtsW/RodA/SpoVE family cell cycle protein [Acutalibacteraceae bacterium]|nr:FtsW/RodA/SpoVE family cell cycle protein [Acutalibacteraceae bacterium]
MRHLMAKIADYFREADKILLILSIFTSLYGTVAVFSATYYKETYRPAITQFGAMLLGLMAAVIISAYDYEKIAKRWYIVAAIGLIPVILTFFIGFAPEGTDDKAWLDLGVTTFQPSELLKVCFTVTFAVHLKRIKPNINKLKYLIPLCIHGAFPVLLIHFQGDDGTALVFAVMVLFMMWTAGVSWKYFLLAFSAAAVASPFIYFFVMNDQHRERIKSLFNPVKDIQGIDYQQWRGSVALANGGWTGQGFLKGDLTQAGAVPESHNDFIFVSIGEEFGFLGCLVVMLLLAAICLRCIRIARICSNDMGKYICVGIFAMIFAQSVINIGMCTSVLPVIGVTLPFFSAGGTSLLCLFLGVGLVLNVYMHRNSRTIYLRD